MISFYGSIDRVVIDREGESKVTFAVPLEALEQVAALSQHPETLMRVTVSFTDGIEEARA